MKYLKKQLKRLAIGTVIALVAVHVLTMKSESYIRARVVKLSSLHGMCSGEQVRAPSGVDYILTAGHCKGLALDDQILVTDAEGHELWRKIVAEDPASDLLLLEGLPGMKGLDIADSEQASEHVRTFTHGANLDTYKTEGEIIQTKEVKVPLNVIDSEAAAAKCSGMPKFQIEHMETWIGTIDICALEADEVAASATIVPGSSGGMLVNDSGELVGVASCTDGQFGYFVTLRDIKAFLAGY